MKQRKYSMAEASAVAEQAAAAIQAFLGAQPTTVSIQNVENDLTFRTQDIDLLWTRFLPNGTIITNTIEIKGDRQYHTGNYFFETISNEGKGTPGCFLYTNADYIFYYFVPERELHILPMPATREWFVNCQTTFKEKKTSTPVSKSNAYITVGRLVPRSVVLAAVPWVKILQI